MSKYGYIGAVPTQAQGSNSGVFSVTDVTKLLNANQWTLQGSLQLISTQSFTSQTNVDFTSIEETNYDTHFFTCNNMTIDAGTSSIAIRYYESGVLEDQSVYGYAYQNRDTTGAISTTVATSGSNSRIFVTGAIGTGDNVACSYGYIYNAGNSSKYTDMTMISTYKKTYTSSRYGGGVLPQTSTVDGIRFFDTGGNNFSGKISLYGVLN